MDRRSYIRSRIQKRVQGCQARHPSREAVSFVKYGLYACSSAGYWRYWRMLPPIDSAKGQPVDPKTYSVELNLVRRCPYISLRPTASYTSAERAVVQSQPPQDCGCLFETSPWRLGSVDPLQTSGLTQIPYIREGLSTSILLISLSIRGLARSREITERYSDSWALSVMQSALVGHYCRHMGDFLRIGEGQPSA